MTNRITKCEYVSVLIFPLKTRPVLHNHSRGRFLSVWWLTMNWQSRRRRHMIHHCFIWPIVEETFFWRDYDFDVKYEFGWNSLSEIGKRSHTHNLADSWQLGCAYHCPFDLAWRSSGWSVVWCLYGRAIGYTVDERALFKVVSNLPVKTLIHHLTS